MISGYKVHQIEEPASNQHTILGDRKLILPEAASGVESVLRTELLDAIPKSMAEACLRHGYCTAELIVWYIMKQLIHQ